MFINIEQAIELLRSADLPTNMDDLRDYLSSRFLNVSDISSDKLKSAVEVISDNEYTIEVVDTTSVRGMYSVDLEENLLYLDEYWS